MTDRILMHNYLKMLAKLEAKGKFKPGLHLIDVYHDNWCGINRGQECNCKPDIKIKKYKRQKEE